MNEFTYSLIASIALIAITFLIALITGNLVFWLLLMVITIPVLTINTLIMGLIVLVQRH